MHEMQGIPNLTIGPFCFIGRCVTGFHHGVLHGLHRPQLSASPAVDAEFTPPRLTPERITQGVEPCQGQVTPCPKPPSEDSLSSRSVEAEGSFARKDKKKNVQRVSQVLRMFSESRINDVGGIDIR